MAISASRTEVEYDGRTPCRTGDLNLWFSPEPADLERAKRLCGGCPIRTRCLIEALDRAEPWGVWGGEILHRGVVVARKRLRGRPRTTVGSCRTAAS